MSETILSTISDEGDRADVMSEAYYYYDVMERPVFDRRIHPRLMSQDARISLVMEIMQGAVQSLARFYVEEENAEIKEFLVRQISRYWRCCSIKVIATAMEFGWIAAEPLYRRSGDGLIEFDNVLRLGQFRARPLTNESKLVGLSLGQGAERPKVLGSEKAFWHIHRRHKDPWFGQSRYYGAFNAWLELYSHGGIYDGRRLFIYKHLVREPPLYHKPGKYTDESGQERYYRDDALQALENARSGGNFVFPAVRDAQGNLLWFFGERPKITDAKEIQDMVIQGRKEITEGLGCPQEVFEAASTGSGFSGRRIPQQAWRGLLQDLAFWAITDADEQIFRPLVRRNFGVDPTHDIQVFGFVRDDEDNPEGEGEVIPMGDLPAEAGEAARFSIAV